MVELEVRSTTGAPEAVEAVEPKEAAIPSLAACIGKLRNEDKSIVKIDMQKVKELCDKVSDAATYKRIALMPGIQAEFNLAFQVLEEFQKGSKHFEQLLGIIGKTESDCEVDYFKIMLDATQGAK
jgi:plasmid replication initiation protein